MDFALRIRHRQQLDFLGTVYDSIAGLGPILARWELGGTDTFGMARFADAWRRRPALYDDRNAVPRRNMALSPIDEEFKTLLSRRELSLGHDALFLLMQCQLPQGPDTPAQAALRAWVFVRGFQLASGGNRADGVLADACHALRRVAYDLRGSPRRVALQPLGIWTTSHEALTDHLKSFVRTRAAKDQSKDPLPPGVRDIARCAAGREKRLDVDDSEDGVSLESTAVNPFSVPVVRQPLDGDDAMETSLHIVSWSSRHMLEEAIDETEAEIDGVDLEMDATPQAQAVHVRSVRFQLGAQARFLTWDWNLASPPERVALDEVIRGALEPECDVSTRLLAAICRLANLTGTTLSDCVQIPLLDRGLQGRDVEWEWSIDLMRGVLMRQPPRRAGHFKPQGEQLLNLRLATDRLDIPIASQELAVLRSAFDTRRHATLLGQLRPEAGLSIESAFRALVRSDPRTRRLQPSMLGRVLGHRVFEQTRDHVLARLVGATADSALPSSTAYAAYRDVELQTPWPGVHGDRAPNQAGLNAAGSLLELTGDEYLKLNFSHACRAVAAPIEVGDWVAYHNAVVLYWDAALRAATGVRPMQDLWSTPEDIDWSECFVFVDDKTSPVTRTGRLVPLPDELCGHLRRYLEVHLPWVMGRIRERGAGSALAPELRMFFLIDHVAGCLITRPLSNSDRRSGNIEAPLPLNLFRHRLRTRLHRSGVDIEIIDTVLGHGDGATLTHGDYSMRVWRDDAQAVRPVLSGLYADLGIESPPDWPGAGDGVAPAADLSGCCFVRRTLKAGRALPHARQARRVIESYLLGVEQSADESGDRPAVAAQAGNRLDSLAARVASLSADEFDRLSKKLLERSDGLPDNAGIVRYDFLLRLAERAWNRGGRIPAIRRRYLAREIEPSIFRPGAVGCLQRRDDLRAELDKAFQARPMSDRLPLSRALGLLLLDLCLTSRLTNAGVLDSLFDDDDPWRVVSIGDEHHLEWSPDGALDSSDASAACMRFAISKRAAWLLTCVIAGKKRRRFVWKTLDPSLRSLACLAFGSIGVAESRAGDEPTHLLATVREVVDQCNAIELPGTIAGYLSGRVCTASLGWAEWLRLRRGEWTQWRSPDVGDIADEATESTAVAEADVAGESTSETKSPRFGSVEDDDGPAALTTETLPWRAKPAASPEARAKASFAAVRLVQREVGALKEKRGLTKRRAAKAAQLSRRLRDKHDEVSSAVQLLCLWAVDLLLRPGRRKLATSSVLRYFGALAPRFLALALDVELASMDEEEIEDFYASIMESSSRVKNTHDVFAALKNFHRFARGASGLPDIDWSSVAVTTDSMLGAPGHVDDRSYLAVLERLESEPDDADSFAWQRQCFLIFARRFGLRGGEIAGLMRADVVFAGDSISHVLVQNNRARNLKTAAARRIVPLLTELEPVERRALQRLRMSQLPVPGLSDDAVPLLSMPGKEEKPISDLSMRRRLNAALQQMTGQPGSTLHDLRHAFAGEVWLATQAGRWLPDWYRIDEAKRSRMTDILLGAGGAYPSRRAPFALARVAGHVHPATALRSYVHFVSDVASVFVDVKSVVTPGDIEQGTIGGMRLDDALAYVPSSTQVRATTVVPDVSAALRAFRLIAAGRCDDEVMEDTGLDADRVALLRECGSVILELQRSKMRSGFSKPTAARGRAMLADDGVPSLLLASAYKRLRNGLAGLDTEQLAKLSNIERIRPAEWQAMVSDRREISLWLRHHFELFALATRHFAGPGAVSLARPSITARGASTAFETLRAIATETGWLPGDSSREAGDATIAPLCSEIVPVAGAAGVLLPTGAQMRFRLVLRVGKSEKSDARNRLELICCALCLNAFAKPTSSQSP
jgi:integrase